MNTNDEKWFLASLTRLMQMERSQRARILQSVLDGQPTLRKVLMETWEDMGLFLARPFLTQATRALSEFESRSLVGRRIGRYRIVEIVGQGGMGTVLRAARDDDQFEKEVAIKIVQPFLPKTMVQRFNNERRILAKLEHENIARLLDGGTTEDGRAFVVMEYIQGQPIDEYCDDKRLTLYQRLELFRQVCRAVHFSHRAMVVHRDIKPNNVLVTPNGVPKLLDFGIAKLLEGDLSSQSVTVTENNAMTPQYASPEQAKGDPTTASSDIYSLGVLLYKLLTGHHPYQLKTRRLHEILSAICEVEPQKPSDVISTTEEICSHNGDSLLVTPDFVSFNRKSTHSKLRRQLTGDLDNIILTAMRKEPNRRYDSAEQFSEDIARHLKGLPVLARRDTLRYRSSKFFVRHRISTAVGILFLLVFIGFLLDRTAHIARVSSEQARAETAGRFSEFLIGLLELSDIGHGKLPQIEARASLDQEAERIIADLESDAEKQATTIHVIGRVYGDLGHYDRSETWLRRAVELRQKLLGKKHLGVASSLYHLAEVCRLQGKYQEAEEFHRRALSIRELRVQNEPSIVAQSLDSLANLYLNQGRRSEANELGSRVGSVLLQEMQLGSRPSDKHPIQLTTRFAIGGFDVSRGGHYSASLMMGRLGLDRLKTHFPEVSLRFFPTLNREATKEIEILTLSAVKGGWEQTSPLSKDEQGRLYRFVEEGGCAILITDNKDFWHASESLIDPFGMNTEGHWLKWARASVMDPSASPITDGPFGTVSYFYQALPGGITHLGPWAKPLSTNPVGVALAAIEPDSLSPGSGSVVIFTDSVFSEILYLNAIRFCLEGKPGTG